VSPWLYGLPVALSLRMTLSMNLILVVLALIFIAGVLRLC
jgi:hypothetical protein